MKLLKNEIEGQVEEWGVLSFETLVLDVIEGLGSYTCIAYINSYPERLPVGIVLNAPEQDSSCGKSFLGACTSTATASCCVNDIPDMG